MVTIIPPPDDEQGQAMTDSGFTKRCPNCYSDDLAPLMVALYICGNCCYAFAIARAINLRELLPQPAPSMSE